MGGRSTVVVLVVLVAVALVACGRTRRLHLVWLQAPDGARSLRRVGVLPDFDAYLYDAARRTHCAVALTKDGLLRCIPYEVDAPFATLGYLDDACTVPVARASADPRRPGPPKYAYDTEPCSGVMRLLEVGAQVPSSTRFYQSYSSGCSGGDLGPDDALYEVRELPMGDLAQVSLETVSGPNRLRATYLTGADGFRVLHGAQDTSLGVACSPSPTADEVRCLPSSADDVAFSGYADAACSRPVAHADLEHRCAYPVLARYPGKKPVCDPDTYAGIVSEKKRPPALFQRMVSTCDLDPPGYSSLDTFFEVGPPVTLAPLTRRLDDGGAGTRLRAYAYDDGFGLVFPSARFRDVREDYDCDLVQGGADGTFTCRPSGANVLLGDTFSDAACTLPLDIFYDYPCEGRPLTPLVFMAGAHTAQERVLDVHTRGPVVTAPVFRRGPGKSKCGVDTRRDEYGITYYLLGPLVRTATMTELVEVIEP